MRIAFTICSNNYLAQAKALGNSLKKVHPEYRFFIALVDKLEPTINYKEFDPYEIVPIDEMGIDDLPYMIGKYNITELNTAVKPFVFNYLFSVSKADSIIYFDPDIVIFNKLQVLEQKLSLYDIIITPHFATPIYDNKDPSEPGILNAGIYNLGFIALRRSSESFRFLKWWMIKLKDYCYMDFANGLFVDQLWINLAPIYFENVYILKNKGYNAAYWNLHERAFIEENSIFFVNDNNTPLVFYHYSGFMPDKRDEISKYQNRFTFPERPDIQPLFEIYIKMLEENKHAEFAKHHCFYIKEETTNNSSEVVKINKSIPQRLKQFIKGKGRKA